MSAKKKVIYGAIIICLLMLLSLPIVGYIGKNKIETARKELSTSGIIKPLLNQGQKFEESCTEYTKRFGSEVVLFCLTNISGCSDTIIYNFSLKEDGKQPITIKSCK